MSTDSFPLRALTTLLAIGCGLALMHAVCVIGFHVPFDPNEGWNAAFTDLLRSTGSPYPPPSSLLINNYPPLSFYAVAAVSALTGDAIIAGRIVALASLFAVAVGIETVARRMRCSRWEALFAALIFAAGVMLTSDYAGMDDPQLLGHAIAMGGLLLALREPRTPRLMIAAALLCVAAFFVKHNLVVLPVALGLWLLLADRRHAITFIASGVIFLLIGMGVFKQIYGVGLLTQIDSARTYALSNVWSGLAQWLPWGALPALGAAALLVVARRDRYAVFCAIYAGLALIAGAYFLGGAGVDANALFDADIALALGAGVLMSYVQTHRWQRAALLLYALPLAFGVWTGEADWRATDFWLNPMAEERATAAADIALIHDARGPVLCEMLSLCYWAGRPAEADVFNLEQAYLTRRRSDAELAGLIAAKRYALIQFEQLKPFPLTPEIRRTLLHNYRVVRTDNDDRVFLVPR